MVHCQPACNSISNSCPATTLSAVADAHSPADSVTRDYLSIGAAMLRFTLPTTTLLVAFTTISLVIGVARGDELFARITTEGTIAADELFSRISNDSVFTAPTNASVPNPATREQNLRGQKILSITQLRDVLRDSGLEPDNDENIVTVKLQHARWTFPVMLGLTDERDQVVLLMLLTEMDGKQPLAADRLLALLSANAQNRPAFFSYSDKRKRIELVVSLENAEISPRLLREELRKLGSIAENTANLWEVTATTRVATTSAVTTAPQQQQRATAPVQVQATPPAAANVAVNQVVGKWSASRSANEAFAMQLNADSSFVLIYVKDGKQSRSTGTFTLVSGQLTLNTSEGGKFGGGVTNFTTRSFDFTPQGTSANKLTFQRAS